MIRLNQRKELSKYPSLTSAYSCGTVGVARRIFSLPVLFRRIRR